MRPLCGGGNGSPERWGNGWKAHSCELFGTPVFVTLKFVPLTTCSAANEAD